MLPLSCSYCPVLPTENSKTPTEISETVGVFSSLFSGFIIRFPFHRDHGPHFACAVAEVAGDEGALVVAGVVQETALPAATGAGETAGVARFRPRPVRVRLDLQRVLHFTHSVLLPSLRGLPIRRAARSPGYRRKRYRPPVCAGLPRSARIGFRSFRPTCRSSISYCQILLLSYSV